MALPASVLLYGYLSGISSLFYPAFPTRKLRYDVCAAVRPPLQGTEGCARSTAVCIIPLHAGASTCRNNRYSAIWASCLIVAPAHSAFCPQLSFPGRRRHGQTVTHSACAVRRISGMSQSERVPILFARQTVFYPPKPSVLLSDAFYTGRWPIPILFAIIACCHSLSATA